jgi:hypothetical protein
MQKQKECAKPALWSFSADSVAHELEADGSYRIDNYDKIPAFSSFLPGIAGSDGVPLWCMYVNRAQAVVSFGLGNKNQAIAEFLPATWAYQLVGVQGFRTFCKVNGQYYEPFQNNPQTLGFKFRRSMWPRPERLLLREDNETLGLRFDVEYFSPINQPLGSLIRLIKITNTSGKSVKLEGLDGLALILPAGLPDNIIKSIRRLSEAYASVKLIDGKIPYYSSKVQVHDEDEVTQVHQGHFYAAYHSNEKAFSAAEPYVDPDVIFGCGCDLITPRNFLKAEAIARDAQTWENRLPCALVPFDSVLEADKSIKLVSIIGLAPSQIMLTRFLANFREEADIGGMRAELINLMDDVLAPATAVSGLPVLDAYLKQNFLDNILRGGIPKLLPSKTGPKLLHLYSRRHGDLERDYNHFELSPTPLSIGPGNYRDICQNRRHDVWFHPEVSDRDIKMFLSLLQPDGYNPLNVDGYRWSLPIETDPMGFCPDVDKKASTEFRNIFRKSFHPGELLQWLNLFNVTLEDRSAWLNSILEKCQPELIAGGYEGGYWIDHWTYITDLLESFAAIFPEKVEQMLTEKADVTWFNEGGCVAPRADKYVLKNSGPLQLNSVVSNSKPQQQMSPVTAFAKLCALVAIKAASFDFKGAAIEMEAGRPGWNDSLNGLPALFGSSTCEAAELGRLASWLLDSLPEIPRTAFPVEVADLIDKVVADLLEPEYSWERSVDIRERFRERVRDNFNGRTRFVAGDILEQLLVGAIGQADAAIEKSVDHNTGLIHTYYRNIPIPVVTPESLDSVELERGIPLGPIAKFEQKPLPLYLEGQVHLLRLVEKSEQARKIYRSVRQSPLFDEDLQMYKLNESLKDWPHEIGRARTFTRGWYENESVWLHMSYKYLLELLRGGLYEEFFTDARTMLVPFMNPKIYGRSILENSSFIASSACPDRNARGRGFIARLSGSTAEFIHIWLLLTIGKHPFTIKDGRLCFALTPVLPGDWFTTEAKSLRWKDTSVQIPVNSFACTLLGRTLLVYHNRQRKNTFGSDAVRPVRYILDETEEVNGPLVSDGLAEKIRSCSFKRVDVWLE